MNRYKDARRSNRRSSSRNVYHQSTTTTQRKRRKWQTKPPPPPVATELEELDLITQLPDSILHSILFLLPIKDAGRASVLSSPWRHLWKAAPLHLDDLYPRRWSNEAVSRIFDSHHGPIETLSLSQFNYPSHLPAIERFMETAVQRGIRELTLKSYHYHVAPSLLHCNSLHYLSLIDCRFPKGLLPSIFPNLKELSLNSAQMPNDLL
ncbi:hypothetical protein LUZ61_011256 [Rhynchospora tenuis]|uniref:F-box domain-containing protein n=1 Tax=Rhynchospora tenuis TaxID=198213 RepID=A0AAD6A0M2_9POAL|nr:hypothetical protein LUZ61_011256 [Rhynchospora tenuis]